MLFEPQDIGAICSIDYAFDEYRDGQWWNMPQCGNPREYNKAKNILKEIRNRDPDRQYRMVKQISIVSIMQD